MFTRLQELNSKFRNIREEKKKMKNTILKI